MAAAHLYVHIPFCPTKCPYCAFVTHVGGPTLIIPYLRALEIEAQAVSAHHAGELLRSVYLGGGTPSLLSPSQVKRLLQRLEGLFGLSHDCEISIEAHPATVTLESLKGYREAGINRISFGGESLNQTELAAIDRNYEPAAILRAIDWARDANFSNINVDLIYGLPKQTVESWNTTLSRIVSHGVNHLSLYPLSIEGGTAFARDARRGVLRVPQDEDVAEMYGEACQLLRAKRFEHYEIASWAQPGRRSVHNLAYWFNRDYYALGVGAHSYVRPYRRENVKQTSRYIELVEQGREPAVQVQRIDSATELAETIIMRLRLLNEGLDLEELRGRYSVDVRHKYREPIDELTRAGLVRIEANHLFLDEQAVPVANEVWQHFV